MTIAMLICLGVILFLAGSISLIIYMVVRMLGSSGWDDSNMTNALRLISHTVLHPEDYLKMYYLTKADLAILEQHGFKPSSPFWYLDKDEFSEVVKTRPPR
jgi:hypothetical protein